MIEDYPTSADDEIFFAKQHEEDVHRQQAAATMSHFRPPLPMLSSSSEDQFTSGLSQSTSHPSIPSVMTRASSLSTAADEGLLPKEFTVGSVIPPLLRTHDTITSATSRKGKGKVVLDDDEDGYIDDREDKGNEGDDDDDEDDDEDEGITFGPKTQKQ